MDREETWALYQQGKDAWNAWAKERLDRRNDLERRGFLSESDEHSHIAAKADFREAVFGDDVDFSEFVFPGEADFGGTEFLGKATFDSAVFEGPAQFSEAVFQKHAFFLVTRFEKTASFNQTTFNGSAIFGRARFAKGARFLQATFNGYAHFGQAVFKAAASFRAIEGYKSFSLVGASFFEVPDFAQANFREVPQLGEIVFKLASNLSILRGGLAEFVLTNKEHTARWRALRKLAANGYDHGKEQEFFAHELKARRWGSDWKHPLLFTSGLIYQWVSGFGLSLFRPLFWLGISLAFFAGLYLGNHSTLAARWQTGFDWAWVQAGAVYRSEPVESLPCEVPEQQGNAAIAAVSLSLRNTLPFAGLGGPEKLNQIYRCLYGVEGAVAAGPNFPPTRLSPHIPNRVAFYGMAQTILSAVLFFLFLLALRNHFRIK